MIQLKEYYLQIEKECSGARLDQTLARLLPNFSRSRLKLLILDEYVFDVETGVPLIHPDTKLTTGQKLVIREPKAISAIPHPQNIPLKILHEDSDLIVVSKAKGMVVHPAAGNPNGTLVNALLYHCKHSLSGIGGVLRPGIVHRLDKDTSGVMVIAKNDMAHKALAEQFKMHSIERCYVALVWGKLKSREGVIETLIGRHPKHRKKMAVVNEKGKRALTRFKVNKCLGSLATIINCTLETGRTHQIRVHMAHIGHPIIGDPLYGGQWRQNKGPCSNGEMINRNYKSQALHACLLTFIHPRSQKKMTFRDDDLTYIMNIWDLINYQNVLHY